MQPCDNLSMRILVIRLSALGDIVHALPALTDLRRALPDATIDFAVDERFVDIARLHGHVDRVLSIPLKRWKRNVWRRQTWAELRATVRSFRSVHYDRVIDVHGVTKSAVLCWLASSDFRAGPDSTFSPDWLPPKIYNHPCRPDGWTPRTQWIRQIAAQAMGLSLAGPADFGLRLQWQPSQTGPIVLVTNTAGPERMWSHEQWLALAGQLASRSYRLILSWGTPQERERVDRIIKALDDPHCVAGPTQSIGAWAGDLSRARLVVGVDTGLLHIAAALGTPCVGIFTHSDPALLISQNPAWRATVGGPGLPWPTADQALQAIDQVLADSDLQPP